MPIEREDQPETEALYESVGGTKELDKNGVTVWDFGWTPEDDIEPLDKQNPYPEAFSRVHPELLGTGAGKIELLYEAARTVWGRDLDAGPQETIDCVSWGVSGAVDLRACVEIHQGEAEASSWDNRVCTEALYGLARVEYGGGGFTNSIRGSIAARDGGTIGRGRLGPYSRKRADDWGRNGLPDDLEPLARDHRARDVTEITSFEEARDAIFNGYPIVIGSSQGFKNGGRRNEDGFAAASKWTKWKHCMKFVGMRDDDQPGLLCFNSWGSHSGPKGKYDIPDGSFWVTAETCNRMFRIGAGFAVGGFEGYPATASENNDTDSGAPV